LILRAFDFLRFAAQRQKPAQIASRDIGALAQACVAGMALRRR